MTLKASFLEQVKMMGEQKPANHGAIVIVKYCSIVAGVWCAISRSSLPWFLVLVVSVTNCVSYWISRLDGY